MRDEEHSREFEILMPELDTYFRAGMRGYVANGDKALLSDDLVQVTGIVSWLNSRKPQYAGYPMDKLIWLKARNVLYCFRNPPKKQKAIQQLRSLEMGPTGNEDPLQYWIAKEDLDRVRDSVDDHSTLSAINKRDEGFSDLEIAKKLGITEPALRKRISRLIADIKARWPNRDAI
jgi:DNA-directed RNA polymerase specialized sigma24 family protein